MVHNGIEYGIMAAYAEGMNILRDANVGKQEHAADAETTPLRDPEHYQYDLNLRDIAEVWRRGSVIASWLLDLTATALVEDPALAKFAGRVSDSGEGRWTIKAAIDEAVPAPVLTDGALRALRLARRGRLRRQAPLRHALPVRRARREGGGAVANTRNRKERCLNCLRTQSGEAHRSRGGSHGQGNPFHCLRHETHGAACRGPGRDRSDPWGMLGWRGVLFPLLSLNMVLVQAFILVRPLRAFHHAFLTVGMVSSIVELRFVGGGVSTIV